ncbi:MFS transporter [Deinococcus fonticola]|uniref:MFS transporter n=1 Tax=Deinococcus fonticola TaxID=2528713 RepID=UPI001074D5B2|nr:MFS transporter [Deinococcus fonticola]
MPLLTGLRGYTVIWAGQLVGVLGSSITRFAIPLWVWQETHSATAMAYMGLFAMLPLLLFSPLAGALVDRWSHHLKRVMMISDVTNFLSGLLLLLLLGTNHLALGWIYALMAFQALAESFQWPSYSLASTVMLPKEQYQRASAMQGTVLSVAGIAAPMLGALLYAQVGLTRIVELDLICAAIAILALLPVLVPRPPRSETGQQAQGNLWKEAVYGFRFIASHPSLLALQGVFLLGNLLSNLFGSLHAPMILARTASNAKALAAVEMAGGISALVAGVLLSAWGGPKKRIYGVLIGWMIALSGTLILGLGQSVPVWILGAVIASFSAPLTNSSNQAIWQMKTPPDVQGKVFAARRVIAWGATPLATLIAGPLADRWLNPGMAAGGSLAPIFGPLVGTGPGAGISLLGVFVGVLGLVIMGLMFSVERVRDVETLVPDFDETDAKAAQPA